MVSYLCKTTKISRSGYYNYFSFISHDSRKRRDIKDGLLRDTIIKAYKFKRRKKGAKQIKMTLESHYGIIYNLNVFEE